METNLDQKQLLVLGYLRDLLDKANVLRLDDDEKESPPLPPLSKYDENIELLPFNLGLPTMQPRTCSVDSVASHLSDHDLNIAPAPFTLPLSVIQSVYLYFNRFQSYLFLLGGSEECKDNSYNQVQIINLRNISDIKQKIEYPYTNFRLSPHLWRDKLDYNTYFKAPTKKNLRSSLTAAGLSAISTAPPSSTAMPLLGIVEEGKTSARDKNKSETPTPISIGLPVEIPDEKKEERPSKNRKGKAPKKRDSTIIKVSGPSSPWTSQNSPYFDSSALIPFNALRNKPRSKSVSKLSKLQKKEAPQVKLSKLSKQMPQTKPPKKPKSQRELKSQPKSQPKSKSTRYIIAPKKGKKAALSAKKKKAVSPKKKKAIAPKKKNKGSEVNSQPNLKPKKYTIAAKKKTSPKKKNQTPKTKKTPKKKSSPKKKTSPKKNVKHKQKTKAKAKSTKFKTRGGSVKIQRIQPIVKRIPKPKKPIMKRKVSAANVRSIPIALKQPVVTNKLKKPKGLMMRRRSANDLLHGKKGKKGKKKMNIVTGNKEFDRYSYGECIMAVSNDVNGAIPNWPWFKAKYKSEIKRNKDALEWCKFKMFVRCGGIYTKDDEYTSENDLFLFNAASLNDVGREIDSYFCTLPSFKQQIESPAIVYNGVDKLLCFGGYSYDEGKALKSVFALNLNTKRSKFKWKKYGCLMNRARYDASVTHVVNNKGQNKFIIIGGKGSSSKPIEIVEMFDSSKSTKSSKCTLLAELNFKRFKPGSCQLHGINAGKIACAGGILYGKGVHKVEMYDANKDKWMVHHTALQYDHQHPTLWAEVPQINPNILYCAGNNISFGAKKGSLGFIEWTDLREKKKQFHLLYDEPIEELFEFWALRPNIWEPRSLLQFQL